MRRIGRQRERIDLSVVQERNVSTDHQRAANDEATEQTMRHLPGFVSANIHRSLDGKRVANYAQWRSAADFQAMLANPAVVPHMQKCRELATYDANLYDVVYIDNPGEPGTAP
jgi:quinol monooxygenase YgiN